MVFLLRTPAQCRVTYQGDEFLDVALIANERGRCTMLFNAKVVEKSWEHFRD